MVHLFSAFLIALSIFVGCASPASAEKLALLISNTSYNARVGPLANTHNDANLVGLALVRAGFKEKNIVKIENAGRLDLLRAIRKHSERVARAGKQASDTEPVVSFVYYAGHGAANPDTRQNFLIPVDVADIDADLWDASVSIPKLITTLERSAAANVFQFVVFDACRTQLTMPQRSASRGFVAEHQRPGMLIAFSTDANQVAYDGTGPNGPYAIALADQLSRQVKRRAAVMFEDVKFSVYQSMERKQFPWHVSKFTSPFFFHDDQQGSVDERPALSQIAQLFALFRQEDDKKHVTRFLKRYPDTVFAEALAERVASATDVSGNTETVVRSLSPAPTIPKAEKIGDYFLIFGSYGTSKKKYAIRESRKLNEKGRQTYVIRTNKYANLRDGYWTVVEGPYNLKEGRRVGRLVRKKKIYRSAYLKAY